MSDERGSEHFAPTITATELAQRAPDRRRAHRLTPADLEAWLVAEKLARVEFGRLVATDLGRELGAGLDLIPDA